MHTPLVGVELTLEARSLVTLPLHPDFEHAILAVDGPATVQGYSEIQHRQMLYLAAGCDRVVVDANRDPTLLLLRGETFTAPLVMCGSFIGLDHPVHTAAGEEW